MKKLITLIFAAILLCGAVSCGKTEPEQKETTAVTPAAESAKETDKGMAEETAPTDGKAESETLAETAVPAETEAKAAETAPKGEDRYICELDNGMAIELGASAEGVLSSLGAPQNVAEAPSCVHEGMDRIYSFNGFSVTTSPDGKGTDRVSEVALTSDAVLLKNGISIGSPLDAVKAAFGENYTEQFGVLQYITDTVKISIVLDDDSCVSSLVITAAE